MTGSLSIVVLDKHTNSEKVVRHQLDIDQLGISGLEYDDWAADYRHLMSFDSYRQRFKWVVRRQDEEAG